MQACRTGKMLWIAALAALVANCATRERPTFPTGAGTGVGPEITITDPVVDTSAVVGSVVLIGGIAFDEEGIDTIFFTTLGLPSQLPPYSADGVVRVRFSFPVTLAGESGDTIIVSIYGANVNHVRGDLVTRRIRLR
jgi:hypothetical protein